MFTKYQVSHGGLMGKKTNQNITKQFITTIYITIFFLNY